MEFVQIITPGDIGNPTGMSVKQLIKHINFHLLMYKNHQNKTINFKKTKHTIKIFKALFSFFYCHTIHLSTLYTESKTHQTKKKHYTKQKIRVGVPYIQKNTIKFKVFH